MENILYKYLRRIILISFIAVITIFTINGCSSRKESPKVLDDGTVIYPSKSADGIYTTITFSNKISKKTGKPLKPNTVFKLQKESKLNATVDLVNFMSVNKKLLMLHIDWLDSMGNSLYKKRIDFTPGDSSSSVTSSISISPLKRKAGSYSVRVYLFRELIAEKKFQLVESLPDSLTNNQSEISKKKTKAEKKVEVKKTIKSKVKTDVVKASIILCRSISKKTGKPVGADTSFTIKDRAKVKAVVGIEKSDIKTNEQMKFYFNWIGPDGKIFYKKRIVYTTSNPSFTISNTISISPEKRKPGIYQLKIVFRKKIIAEQKFELVEQKL